MHIITLEQAKCQLPEFIIVRLGVDKEWGYHPAIVYKKSRVYGLDSLSKQYILEDPDGKTMFICLWDSTLPLPTVKYPSNYYLIVCDVHNTNLMTLLRETPLRLAKGKINCYLFYSDVDVQCLMSESDYKQFLVNGVIEKKRNLNGKCIVNVDTLTFDYKKYERIGKNETYLNLYDLFGSFNSGLDDALASVEIDPQHKDLVSKKEKSNMRKVAESDPNRFFKYAMGDVEYLFDLWDRRVTQLRQIVKDTLDIDMGWDIDNCPRSSGKLTESVFRAWLAKLYPEVLLTTEFLADVGSKADFCVRHNLKNAYLTPDNTDVVMGKRVIPVKDFCSIWDSKTTLSGLSHGSISAFGKKPLRFNQNLGALVNGGRCVNENPTRFILEKVFDIDLSSCYGSALKEFSYPIGIPTNITGKTTENEPCKSLGDMLTTIAKFEPNLWVAYVHTESELSFSQDLIFSNPDIDSQKIHQKIVKRKFDDEGLESAESELDKTHIDGGFCMVKRELLNGILTIESLDICRKVMSSKEWSEFKSKVKVDVVVGYLTQDKVSAEEYADTLYNPKTRGQFDIIMGDSEVDNRTRKWLSVPLKDFIQPFISQRKAYKKQVQSKGDKYDQLQNGCKLFINTLYGVMASPYFATSNTIIANNITDRARCGVWMLGKALGTNMSITDGGAYQFDDCRILTDGYLPGMGVMSDYKTLNSHRTVKTKPIIQNFDNFYTVCKTLKNAPESVLKSVWCDLSDNGYTGSYSTFLACLDAAKPLEDLHKCLDEVAAKRIAEFWTRYGLEFKFDLAHKETHTSLAMVHFNKSDYLFIDPLKGDKDTSESVGGGHNYVVKVRGAKQLDHMKKQLLGYLGGLVSDCDKYQVIDEFIKPNELREILHREGLDTIVEPGMRQEVVNTLKVNFNQLPFETFAQRKYHLGQIEKTVRELTQAQSEYIQNWANTGDIEALKDLPQHPIFVNASKTLDFHTYVTQIYLVNGHDLAIQTKRQRANKTKPSTYAIVEEYYQLLNSGLSVGQTLERLAEKYSVSERTVKRYVKDLRMEFVTVK